jgi:hypothetical protein
MAEDTIVVKKDGEQQIGEAPKPKRRKKEPRPGESIFRVPLNLNTVRRSLPAVTGTSSAPVPAVRKRLSISDNIVLTESLDRANERASSGSNVDKTENEPGAVQTPSAPPPLPVNVRGGTKLKFRAYIGLHEPQDSRKKVANTHSLLPPTPPIPSPAPSPILPAPSLPPVASQSPQKARRLDWWSDSKDQPSTSTTQISEINFANAPLDNPAELTWWLAHQVSHMENSRNQGSAEEAHQPDAFSPGQFYGSRVRRTDELRSRADRQREENRERKQRWRSENREKSNVSLYIYLLPKLKQSRQR